MRRYGYPAGFCCGCPEMCFYGRNTFKLEFWSQCSMWKTQKVQGGFLDWKQKIVNQAYKYDLFECLTSGKDGFRKWWDCEMLFCVLSVFCVWVVISNISMTFTVKFYILVNHFPHFWCVQSRRPSSGKLCNLLMAAKGDTFHCRCESPPTHRFLLYGRRARGGGPFL